MALSVYVDSSLRVADVGADKLAGKAAVVEARLGRGVVVLLGRIGAKSLLKIAEKRPDVLREVFG